MVDPPISLRQALERHAIIGAPLLRPLSQCKGYFGTRFFDEATLVIIERIEQPDPEHASVYITENAGTFAMLTRFDLQKREGFWRVVREYDLSMS